MRSTAGLEYALWPHWRPSTLADAARAFDSRSYSRSWRRLVVPARLAYGEEGLAKNARGAMLVKPNEDVYVDLLMMEEAKCDPLLRPVVPKVGRVGFAHEGNQRSLLCRPGVP